ncbi:MAG TPA: aminotransferase class I/II-fold pyridoxal phosphate-dependent enzyme, partial [Polyangiaceae bacterium]|nr:aminotransferase class I/II-fold pyridoxal phosphate-dependent enzyme [Polyangiaceae bacterium]
MRIPVDLDRSSTQPLANQLADQLRDAITHGRIPAGARLPSSRALADQLGLARNTVVRAYETLTIEALVESRAATGFFATRRPPDERLRRSTAPSKPPAPAGDLRAMPLPVALPLPLPLPPAPGVEGGHRRALYDFVPGRPSADLFPLKTWRRLLQGCLSYGGATGLSDYGDPGGHRPLCAAIAAHLSISRGIVADPAQIVIVAGVQEGLNLAARLFLSPGATAVLENPCYRGASLAFAASGARILGVAVDEDGLVTSLLPEGPAALLYVTPGHQYPTGHTMSVDRRADLVAWARRNACYLVEDDYDSEFQYDGSPLQALAGMAPDCTIHLGTFSTTLGAGLRLGYVVVPPTLIDAMRAAKALFGQGSPWLDQAVLAEFLRGGSYAAHLARCRAQYKESRDALSGALRRHFGNVEISGEGAGLHVLWRLPAGVPEAGKLEALARQNHVGVYSFRSAAATELGPSALLRRCLLLGFAGLVPKQIEQGIARLSDVVDDTLDDDHDFIGELLVDEPLPYRPRLATTRRSSGRGGTHPLRRQAIRTIAPRRDDMMQELGPMRIVRGIYRYPVKGLSPQPLRGVELEAGRPFPFDRVFALARPAVPIDVAAPRWAKKGLFLMLMLDETLASVQTYLDVETMRFTVVRGPASSPPEGAGKECLLDVDLTTAQGREAVEAFFRRQVPRLQAPPTLVHAPDGHFMDKPDNVISCINLATVRSLEAEWGRAIHPLRFRANFYIEGARPWEEFDWVGSDIMLGDVLFRVDRRNGRCGATNVNPVTGERDMDIPGSLRKRFGHKDLGVYLVARTGGKVVAGDRVTVPELQPSSPATGAFALPSPGRGTFICRGCYFIYDEAKVASETGRPASFAAV